MKKKNLCILHGQVFVMWQHGAKSKNSKTETSGGKERKTQKLKIKLKKTNFKMTKAYNNTRLYMYNPTIPEIN